MKNRNKKTGKTIIKISVFLIFLFLIIYLLTAGLSFLHSLLAPIRRLLVQEYTVYYTVDADSEILQNKAFYRTAYHQNGKPTGQSNWFNAPIVDSADSFLDFVKSGGVGFGFVPADLEVTAQPEIELGIKDIYTNYLTTGELVEYHYFCECEYTQNFSDLITYLFYKNYDLTVNFEQWNGLSEDDLITINYHANGGNFSNSLTHIYKTYNTSGFNEQITLSFEGIQEPTRSNYTFLGWDTSEGAEITTSIVVRALWQQITPDMFVYFYNGDIAIANMHLPAESFLHYFETYGVFEPTYITLPTRAGYTFTCWNTKADGSGVAYYDFIKLWVQGETTEIHYTKMPIIAGIYRLYAIWEAV